MERKWPLSIMRGKHGHPGGNGQACGQDRPEKHQAELKVLERDVVKLEHILSKPFAHMNYDDAIEYLQKQGHEIQWAMTSAPR